MPRKLRDLYAILKARGVEVATPTTGSHWKAIIPGRRPYPIPAHNGLKTEIPDEYLRGLARALGLANVRAFIPGHEDDE